MGLSKKLTLFNVSKVHNSSRMSDPAKTSRSQKSKAKSSSSSKDPYHASIASWVIYSIRRTIGEADVRNELLSHYLPKDSKRVLGPTFVLIYKGKKSEEDQQRKYYAEIEKYLDKITKPTQKGKTFLFTVANPPSLEGPPETHYQTVVVVNSDSPSATFIDPAHLPDGKEGIYAPYAVTDCVRPFLERKGYSTQWLPVTHAAQTDEEDVFCQSWSLYLLKEHILRPMAPVQVPSSQSERYKTILDFWKGASSLPLFCKILLEDFEVVVNIDKKQQLTEEVEAGDLSLSAAGRIMEVFQKVQPCAFLKTMTVKDIENA
jgi:hypothetical protein